METRGNNLKGEKETQLNAVNREEKSRHCQWCKSCLKQSVHVPVQHETLFKAKDTAVGTGSLLQF